jgi:hypothetical protein
MDARGTRIARRFAGPLHADAVEIDLTEQQLLAEVRDLSARLARIEAALERRAG